MRELDHRIKSLLWRAAMFGIACALDFVLQELAFLDMPDAVTLILGLVLGEVSKFLHNKYRK